MDDTGYVRAALRLYGSAGGPEVAFWGKDHERMLARLSMSEDDGVLLVLSGKTGRHQITVQTSDDGPVVGLADADGRVGQLVMSVPKAGQARISLNGKELVPADAAQK